MTNSPSLIERTAYHEAGHAIAAIRHRVRLYKASIVREATSSGRVSTRNALWHLDLETDTSSPTRRRIEDQVMVLLAGPAAEAYFVEERRDAKWDPVGSSADIETAVGLLGRLGGHEDETEAYFDWMTERVRSFVSTQWESIDAVAQELLERQTLRARRIRQIDALVGAGSCDR